MSDRERLDELLGAMQRDLLPSLVAMEEQDDVRLLHLIMLQTLERGGEPTMKELASIVGRSESRISRVVDQLVQKDFVRRCEDPNDRRVRRLRIGEEGSKLLGRLRKLRIDSQLELMQYMTDAQRRTVFRALEYYAEAARRFRDDRDRSR